MKPEDVPEELIDLAALHEQLAEALERKWEVGYNGWDDLAEAVRPVVESALAAQREQIAAQIEAHATEHDDGSAWGHGMDRAAEIARGESR